MSRRRSSGRRSERNGRPPNQAADGDASQAPIVRRVASSFSIWPDVSWVSLKEQWPHLVVVFVALFSLYAYSAPRAVALEDNGLFIMSSYFLGIDHPPGYPLHTLLGRLSTLLPVGSIAFRAHLLSAFLGALTCVVTWLLVPARREVLRTWPRMLGIAVIACLLPYAWMVARSRMDPETSFYGPIGDLESFLFFVSRQGFRHVDVSQSAAVADRFRYLAFLLAEMVRQYTPVGAALAGFGLVQQWRRWNVATTCALLAGWLGSSLVLGAMLGFDYEPLMTTVIRRYPLIPYGVLSIWL